MLFSYCREALRLSEDAACNRIEAARACRRFPVILELLASGSLSLTSVRLLGRHLPPENHQAIFAKATRPEPSGDRSPAGRAGAATGRPKLRAQASSTRASQLGSETSLVGFVSSWSA